MPSNQLPFTGKLQSGKGISAAADFLSTPQAVPNTNPAVVVKPNKKIGKKPVTRLPYYRQLDQKQERQTEKKEEQ